MWQLLSQELALINRDPVSRLIDIVNSALEQILLHIQKIY